MSRPPSKSAQRFHLAEPDYSRPLFKMPEKTRQTVLEKLTLLYGQKMAEFCLPEVERLMQVYWAKKSVEMIELEKSFNPTDRFTQEDVILITYGDLIHDPDSKPLDTLANFCRKYLLNTINTLHILPFYPYTSDRGFAVLDFEQVDPRLGAWDDISNLNKDFRLMFDAVFNHVSSKCRWFDEFRAGNPDFADFFIVFSTKSELTRDQLAVITRPRATPLLTEFLTLNGPRWVWTTFSEDQVDLNYKNPKVLLLMLQVLLNYLWRGADLLRLDAVTYLWWEKGTSCVHMDQTHAIIQLLRAVIDAVAPRAALVTETNVPHALNISYFGDGNNEAHMVYNFALPPLVLHAFQNQSAFVLTRWAQTLKPLSDLATYFNFLDSHDGVGITPVIGILSPEEIEMMALTAVEHGGYISYKDDGEGNLNPYEINITWYSAINRPDSDEDDDFQVGRFLASRAIALVLQGVPGIYGHSLVGTKNDADAVLAEAHARAINRKVVDAASFARALEDPDSVAHKVSMRFSRMIAKRIKEPAFHPNGPQQVFYLHEGVFALLRTSQDRRERILCLTNVTAGQIDLSFAIKNTPLESPRFYDLLGKTFVEPKEGRVRLVLAPYQVAWLKAVL
ncbi:MAG: sugar phosphorylase [Desulfatibacillaceae bacterium]|nr:sugar phosphorylase [Desulfatibacillaceae bacterium]